MFKYLNPVVWLRFPKYLFFKWFPFVNSIPFFPQKHWTKREWVTFSTISLGMWESREGVKKELARLFGNNLEGIRLSIDGEELLISHDFQDVPLNKMDECWLSDVMNPYGYFYMDKDIFDRHIKGLERDANSYYPFKGFLLKVYDDEMLSGQATRPEELIKDHLYGRLNSIGLHRDTKVCDECDHEHDNYSEWEFQDECAECDNERLLPEKVTDNLAKFHKFVVSAEADCSINKIKENKGAS